MISKSGNNFDFILITAEYYDDHPLSPSGVIARVLDSKGYSVGIIEKPSSEADFIQLGKPLLSFCVTSGSLDSMVNNYTPMKKQRQEDELRKADLMPDRAVIVYCNKIREYFKSAIIVIGGIEASLRRFAHYDYWDNKVRRSILFDSRANILVYGNGEKQLIEIAKRLKKGDELKGIDGTCIISRGKEPDFEMLPSFDEVVENPKKYCHMQAQFSNHKNLAQEYDNNYVLQYKYPVYTSKDLDWIYSLDYSRALHPDSVLKMAEFSVVTHRGCIGKCNFCSLPLHQGDRIISRTEKSILKELEKLILHPNFKGYIDDLQGPSANMYGMDCDSQADAHSCMKNCFTCSVSDKSHLRLIRLLAKAREIPGIKKVFIRSGIRYDIALNSKEYINEISEHHISGTLKIAPEHFSEKVLRLMNKGNSRFEEFSSYFNSINRDKKQSLRYYFMIGHPGDDMNEVRFLKDRIIKGRMKNIEQFQFFTPTPMTVSSCMYWTGLNPFRPEKVKVIRDFSAKKEMKRVLLDMLEKSRY